MEEVQFKNLEFFSSVGMGIHGYFRGEFMILILLLMDINLKLALSLSTIYNHHYQLLS